MTSQIHKLTRLLLVCSTVLFSISQIRAQARVERNVVYGMYSGLALTMDVYYPNASNNHGVIFIPGSGWHNPGNGYADEALKVGYDYINEVRDALVASGLTVFVPNHRSAPRFTYPAAVEDVRRAVRFIRHHATRFGIDPARIGGLGHSSGAHLVSLLGTENGTGDAQNPDPVERRSSKIQAVAAIAAPFDLAAFSGGRGLATVVGFMGARPPTDWSESGTFLREGRYAEASPVTHVTPDDAPFLVLQGDRDAIVPADQADIMVDALQEAGVAVESILIENGSHSPPLDVDKIQVWLNEQLTMSTENFPATPLLTTGDVVALESPEPEFRIQYGTEPLQYGHFRLPEGDGPHPVVAFIHGGCWLSEYTISHAGQLEQALTEAGYAVWSLEYRRVGDPGGGWPATFEDIGSGVDYLRTLANKHPLDLNRVIVAGHSAGGHLALWAAARHKIPEASDIHTSDPLPIRGVLALAPAADLEGLHQTGVCDQAVDGLMGGSPASFPERYAAASPMQLAPLGVPQTLILGVHDATWSPSGYAYLSRIRAAGDITTVAIEAHQSGHFEMIVPTTSTWPLVIEALDELKMRIEEH